MIVDLLSIVSLEGIMITCIVRIPSLNIFVLRNLRNFIAVFVCTIHNTIHLIRFDADCNNLVTFPLFILRTSQPRHASWFLQCDYT